jgi:hypothetical protein
MFVYTMLCVELQRAEQRAAAGLVNLIPSGSLLPKKFDLSVPPTVN